MRNILRLVGIVAVVSSATGCSKDPATAPPAPDLAASGEDMRGSSSSDLPDLSTSLGDLYGCTFQFGDTRAYVVADGTEVPPRGGMADGASVIEIRVSFSMTMNLPMKILYDTRAASCAQATFPNVVTMTSTAGSPGTMYYEYIPAQSAGTHVCWKVAADTCNTRLYNPPPGTPSFDYTTL